MKLFGIMKSFDSAKGYGEITPEPQARLFASTRARLRGRTTPVPSVGQRLSYELGANDQHQPRALNLQTA